MALHDAGLSPQDVGFINAHGTATRENDLMESHALHEVFPHVPPVTSLKGTLGHSLGATGAIEAVFSWSPWCGHAGPPVCRARHWHGEASVRRDTSYEASCRTPSPAPVSD
ncbi:hypothetical protein AB0F13_05220 [Streptomyces sp. NPDC026206]|uniref:hypothetical protein n=1 Tax=Streptomyces sp. NPDC026206 TaxID=3157089 RepID=UPI003402376C